MRTVLNKPKPRATTEEARRSTSKVNKAARRHGGSRLRPESPHRSRPRPAKGREPSVRDGGAAQLRGRRLACCPRRGGGGPARGAVARRVGARSARGHAARRRGPGRARARWWRGAGPTAGGARGRELRPLGRAAAVRRVRRERRGRARESLGRRRGAAAPRASTALPAPPRPAGRARGRGARRRGRGRGGRGPRLRPAAPGRAPRRERRGGRAPRRRRRCVLRKRDGLGRRGRLAAHGLPRHARARKRGHVGFPFPARAPRPPIFPGTTAPARARCSPRRRGCPRTGSWTRAAAAASSASSPRGPTPKPSTART